MSASPEKSSIALSDTKNKIKKLGIIAGGGELPRLLIAHCDENNIEPYIIGFKGQTDIKTLEGQKSIKTRIGAAAKIFKWISRNDVQDIVFIGSIERPKMMSLWPDFTAFWFFMTKGIWAKGDNALLILARKELEKRGVKLWGVHNFLPDLLAPEGLLTKHKSKAFDNDIVLGVVESQKLGAADIGQAVIVKEGRLIGTEDQKGTNALIAQYGCRGAVLVKTCKPQQDKDLDLPTIGLGTVRACAAKSMAGIVVHADNSLIVNQKDVIAKADEHTMFIRGVSI